MDIIKEPTKVKDDGSIEKSFPLIIFKIDKTYSISGMEETEKLTKLKEALVTAQNDLNDKEAER